MGRKFRRNRSISHGKGDRSKYLFLHLMQKFDNSKWPSFLRGGKFFGKLQRVVCRDILWVENFDEITLSHTVKEIEANLCFSIFGTNLKIYNGRNFFGGGEEIFLENCQ